MNVKIVKSTNNFCKILAGKRSKYGVTYESIGTIKESKLKDYFNIDIDNSIIEAKLNIEKLCKWRKDE